MEEPPPEITEDTPEEEPLMPQRRLRYKSSSEAPSSPSENLGSVIVFLSALFAQLQEDEKRTSTPTPVLETGRKVLQEKRLSRSGVPFEAGAIRSGPVGGTESDPLTTLPKAEVPPGPEGLGAPESSSGMTNTRPVPARNHEPAALFPTDGPPPRVGSRLLPLVLGLAVLELLVAGYLGWRVHGLSSGHLPGARGALSAADLPADETVSDEALAVANQALEAIGKGDLIRASALLTDAQQRRVALPGLSYQAALLAHSMGEEDKMEEWMDRSIAAHELTPECWYLRASSEAAQSDFKSALSSLETAAHFAPFSPRYQFFWGEYLRRTGTPALALPCFQQALRCRPSSTDTELILFKTRLAHIETGNDASFQAELAAQLDREDVSGDTWLLAAANEINRAAFPAAAEDLRRAARVMPVTLLRSRLRDYVFQSQAKQPDLAAFWSTLAPAAPGNVPAPKPMPATASNGKVPVSKVGRVLVDPATRSLADADPAGW